MKGRVEGRVSAMRLISLCEVDLSLPRQFCFSRLAFRIVSREVTSAEHASFGGCCKRHDPMSQVFVYRELRNSAHARVLLKPVLAVEVASALY